MAEYVMIASVIAIIVYAGYQSFGATLGTQVTSINHSL
jgi:Flp pilus assembly pilin Flp